MQKLPSELKLTWHAQRRLEERNNTDNYYDIKNIMRSPCKWYGKDDLIYDCALYRRSCYTCRKSAQLGYLTDGNIEIVYNRNTKTVLTILEYKDKFKPIEDYIKPSVLKEIEDRKVVRKMKKFNREIGTCKDCERENEELMLHGMYEGLCDKCRTRKQNAKSRGKEYIPYKDLNDAEKLKIDTYQSAQARRLEETEPAEIQVEETKIQVVENYYQAKAEQKPAITHVVELEKPVIPTIATPVVASPLSDQDSFVNTLRGCGCEIPQDTLKNVLNVLVSTDKLKDVFMTIARNDSQQAILDLEQALNVVERKLQHDWEYNGFQEEDDMKFKSFLTWRRILKGSIFFWKKLYQTNALIEMQRAWNAYTADPNDKILLAGDRIDSTLKRYQITTESISTIFNTKRPFTRVFYAKSEEDAHDMLVKWFADRQLHENKSKTTIVELTSEGEDGRGER